MDLYTVIGEMLWSGKENWEREREREKGEELVWFGLVCFWLIERMVASGKWQWVLVVVVTQAVSWVNNTRHTEPDTILFYLFLSFILFLPFDRSNLPWAPTSSPFIIFESPLQSPYLLFFLFPCKVVIFFLIFFNF